MGKPITTKSIRILAEILELLSSDSDAECSAESHANVDTKTKEQENLHAERPVNQRI